MRIWIQLHLWVFVFTNWTASRFKRELLWTLSSNEAKHKSLNPHGTASMCCNKGCCQILGDRLRVSRMSSVLSFGCWIKLVLTKF